MRAGLRRILHIALCLSLVATPLTAGCLALQNALTDAPASVDVPLPRLGATAEYTATPGTVIYDNGSDPSFYYSLPRTEEVLTHDGRWVDAVWVQLQGEPQDHDNGPGWVFVVSEETNRLVQWRNHCVSKRDDQCLPLTSVLWLPGRPWLMGASPFMGQTLTVGERVDVPFPLPGGDTVHRPYEVRPGPTEGSVRVEPVGDPQPRAVKRSLWMVEGFWNATYIFDGTSPFPRKVIAPPEYAARAPGEQAWNLTSWERGDGQMLFQNAAWPPEANARDPGVLGEALPRADLGDRTPPTRGEVPANLTLPEARGYAEEHDPGLQRFLQEHPRAVIVDGDHGPRFDDPFLPPGPGSNETQGLDRNGWFWSLVYVDLPTREAYHVDVEKQTGPQGPAYRIGESAPAEAPPGLPENTTVIPQRQVPLDDGILALRALEVNPGEPSSLDFNLVSPRTRWDLPRYTYEQMFRAGDGGGGISFSIMLSARSGHLERALFPWNATEEL